MKVGDYIKFVRDNVGLGPQGSYKIDFIDGDEVWFTDDCFICLLDLIDDIEKGNAYILKDPLIKRHIDKHTFEKKIPAYLPF